jgi:hypothetical protein
LLDYDDGSGPAATVSKGVAGTGIQFTVPALQGHGLWLLLAGLAGTAIVSLHSRGGAHSAAAQFGRGKF